MRPNCPYGGFVNAINGSISKSKIVVCEVCKFEQCIECITPWHPGIPCSENKKKRKADTADDWINTFSKACPKCHTCIEKDEGCYHMSCSRCGFDFCWLCLKEYDINHIASFHNVNENAEIPVSESSSSPQGRDILPENSSSIIIIRRKRKCRPRKCMRCGGIGHYSKSCRIKNIHNRALPSFSAEFIQLPPIPFIVESSPSEMITQI